MCGNETQKAIIVTQLIRVKFRCMYTLSHMSRPHTLSVDYETLEHMNVYTKTKVLFTFGSLETLCVEMRPELPIHVNRYVHTLTYVKAPYFVS